PTTTTCLAVGFYFDGFTYKTLVEQLSAPTWSVVASPNPPDATDGSFLNGVSCLSTTRCYAVGAYSIGSTSKTLTQRWNGTSWSIVPSPNPTNATFSVLNGVSCPTTTSCDAVGSYFDGSTNNTLVEHWNGTSWSIVTTPGPAGATGPSGS